MLEICAWLCFVIISAYYCGALTMFFAVKQDVQFKTALDAIKLFPGTKLTSQRAIKRTYVYQIQLKWLNFQM